MKTLLLKFLICFALLANTFQSQASHIVGSDLSYSCTNTAGIWHIKLTIYRDCSGIPLGTCTGACGSTCSYNINWATTDPACIYSGSFAVNLTSVTDVNPNPQCPTAKSICTNMGCETAGSYTPGIEKYVFEGDVNLGSSVLPSTCCNVRIYYSECCRNGSITTGAAGQSFYIEALINRCTGANNPCNSSPEFSNDPFFVLCSGQAFVYNNGAIDPDHDSITYAFAPALTGPGSSVTYNSPYSYDAPMPYGGAKNNVFPLGISCDPHTGDVMFTPPYSSSSSFAGVMVIEIKQWRTINGVITNIGTTRRDIQMWIVTCSPNNQPTITTNPSNGIQPKLSWQVCVGEQICFDVIGKDTDYLPSNSPPISDTTYLSWNGSLTSKGATFLPTYNTSLRSTNGPREDQYQFCWTPSSADTSSIPYYFTISTKDSRCPNAGQSTRAFSITVLTKADVSIVKTNLKCGDWKVTYVKNKPSQSLVSTVWNISKVANDFSGMSVNTYLNAVTVPVQHFNVPGKYLVELDINTPGPSGGNSCQSQFFDTITVDTFVQVFVSDTSLCHGNTITIPYYAKWGQAPYTFRWFIAPDTSLNPLNSPFFASTSFTLTPQTTKRYTLQVRDFNGCRAYDSNVIITVHQPIIGNISGPQNLCNISSSSPVIYSISPQVNSTIFWKINDGTFLSGQTTDSISVQWTANGTWKVSVKITDTLNCSDSASIDVSGKADVSIIKNNLRCGNWSLKYVNNKPSQSFTSVIWNISKVANDYSGLSVNTYLNTITPPIQQFTIGGKYLVELDINTPGQSGGNPCLAQFFDTITVDTFVQVFVSDTSLCRSNTITIPYYAKWGQPPYTFRWFIAPDTLYPLNGPFYASSSFTLTPQSTKRYTLQVRDFNGCRGYDSNVIITVYQPIIGTISGPQNLNNISTPVNYSITPQAKDNFIWSVFGGSILSGQTTNAISVQWSSNGIKTVTLMATDSNNCYDSIGENVTINVGLNKVTGFANLSVYPNPTTGLLNVDFESSEKTIDLEVLDVLGKSILRSTSKHSGGLFQKTLDLSALQEGIYFVKISVGEKSTTVKVTLD